MRTLFLALALTLAFTAAAASGATSTGRSKAATAVALKPSPLVGRWSQIHTCQELVGALQKAGLKANAPAIVGDYFPNSTPQQLARRRDLCSGAAPLMQSRFFTTHGAYGSLNHYGHRDDNGHYRILSNHRLRINNGKFHGTFHYRIINGNRLQLAPIITAAMRSQALASPLNFSNAGWQVWVSDTGQAWKHVRCGPWCSH
jgi:hypothetical protein